MIKRLSFPSTFEIAILLTLIVFFITVFGTNPLDSSLFHYSFEVLSFWKRGFWDLLEFTMQMVLILILGHALALSRPVDLVLRKLALMVKSNTQAVLMTGAWAILGGYINWGFGLVLGAIFAKKIGETAKEKSIPINYGLVGASGYLGMLVWHGGMSGSATLKVAESGHFLQELTGIVSIDKTVFSAFNLWINAVLIFMLVLVLFYLSRKQIYDRQLEIPGDYGWIIPKGNDRLGWWIGTIMLIAIGREISSLKDEAWSFVDLNFVNFSLLALGLLLNRSLKSYVDNLSYAVKGATDIIIQFPFYAGILGMMKYSGLLVILADDMVARSGPAFFPFLSFWSAAIVNFFIPSGGGQWAIQGPIMMDAALKMGLDIPKMILVFAYGDQVSNMLQPFWALPLLSITGLPAKEIFKYTVYFFFIAALIFSLGILIWVS